MITRIEIDGFKSFKDFKMNLTPFTVIAGVNASGKSNLFDALQLLSRIAEVDLRTAFSEQRGDAEELFLQYNDETRSKTMSFAVEMLVDKKVKDNWGGEAELKYTRLRYEVIIERRRNAKGFEDLFVISENLVNLKHNQDQWIKLIDKNLREYWRPPVLTGKRGVPYIQTEEGSFIIPQDGTTGNKRTLPAVEAKQSALSGITTVDFKHIFAAREEMRSWKFLQFNPEDLREPTKQGPNASDVISHSGKNLAASLFRIKQDDEHCLIEISRMLNCFLPEFTEVQVYDDRANKQFIIKLKGQDGREFSSRVLSEGTLRLLALCILIYDYEHKNVLCFEEPENGIHPARIRDMIELLKQLSTDFNETDFGVRQVIVNTHSPVVIGELLKIKEKNISIFLAKANTLLANYNNNRYKIQITKMIPAINDNHRSIFFPNNDYTEQELKISAADIVAYLNTTDFETITKY